MRYIATGGFFHESNTFNPIVTGAEDFLVFEREEIYANGEAYPLAKGINDYFKDKQDYTLVPLLFARAVPNGEVDEAFYLSLRERFFAYLQEAPRIDAFVLALHGSMRVKNIGSAETDLLRCIRLLYPEVPIVCGLDMHATLTAEMLKHANAFTGFKTAPHTDAWETGRQAAEMADFTLSTGIPLTMAWEKIDCLIAGEKSETDCEPMRSLIGEINSLEEDDDVCAASYLLGFPWADALENGVTALLVTKNNRAKAQEYASFLAEKFHEHRSEFCFSSPAYPAEEALTRALQETCKPVYVSDSGDNPTAGSTADNTTIIGLLSSTLKHLTTGKKILVAGIYDPYAVNACSSNMNELISLQMGGNFDTLYCQPVLLEGTPLRLVENYGYYQSALVLFHTEQFDLILSSRHIGFTSTDIFTALEIDHLNMDVIVVKLGYLTEDFKLLAKRSYLALTQGCSDEVLERLSYSGSYDLI